jgi:hypothetical protein
MVNEPNQPHKLQNPAEAIQNCSADCKECRGLPIPSLIVQKKVMLRSHLHRTVSTPRSGALQGVNDPTAPVLEEVWHVANRIAVREEVPASRAVAVVVEPGAENEVCRDAEEDTT